MKEEIWKRWLSKDISYTGAAMGAMQEYAKLKCAEQRHECQIERNKRSIHQNGIWYVACDDVLNAEEPNWC